MRTLRGALCVWASAFAAGASILFIALLQSAAPERVSDGIMLGLGLTAAACLSAAIAARIIARPAESLSEAFRLLSAGAFKDAYIAAAEAAEPYPELKVPLRKLTADLQQLQERAIRREKLELTGELIASVSNALENPLNSISVFASMLLEEERTPVKRAQLENIRAESRRCLQILERMAYFRPGGSARERIPVVELVEETVRSVQRSFALAGHDIVYDFQSAPAVEADRSQLRQAILQLLMNARDALDWARDWKRKGTLGIRIRDDGGRAMIAITDNGCGIQKAYLQRVFDPFFSTKPPGQAPGLGLSVAAEIVRSHGGELLIQSEEAAWTTATIELPLAPAGSGPEAAPSAQPAVDAPSARP